MFGSGVGEAIPFCLGMIGGGDVGSFGISNGDARLGT